MISIRLENMTHLSAASKKHIYPKIGIILFKRLEKVTPCKSIKKQEGVAILISNKADFKQKLIRTDRERHYVLLKEKKTTNRI